MKRYFTRPKSWCDDDVYLDESPPQTMTVHEPEGSTYTGLLDANEEPIYSSTRITMGFIK